jgi:hypothetical protein
VTTPLRKVLLPTFGGHVFGLEPDPAVVTLHIPPVIRGPFGLDLDHGALLLFDRVVVDTHAVEYVFTANVREHRQLKESLHVLLEEGIAERHDYAAITRRTAAEYQEMLRLELRSPLDWRDEAAAAAQIWRQHSRSLLGENEIGGHGREAVPFGVWQYLANTGQAADAREIQRIERLLAAKRKRFKPAEEIVIAEVSKTYLSAVNHSLLLARETEAAVYDWSNMRGFYRTKFLRIASRQQHELAQQSKIRELFDVAVPDLQPRDAMAFVSLHRDKRVSALWTLIADAVSANQPLDREFYIRTLEALREAEVRTKMIRKRLAWLTTPLMLMPWGLDWMRDVIGEVTERVVERRHLKPFQWLILLNDLAANATPRKRC